MLKSKILFLMSGSVAAFKACQALSQLVKDGHEVQVVATPATFNFIGNATLEGLSGRKVLSDLWESGHAMEHIHLSRWADFGLLCPASANTLARMAGGFADDLVSALTLAWPKGKPLTIFPAMNHEMLKADVTQANLQRLAARGFRIAPTQDGSLACGEEGAGRMLEAEEILRRLSPPRLGQILITGGATREPVDGIRFLSNVSTGQTAATLCQELSARGWQVTYLHGVGAALPAFFERRRPFTSFGDLDHILREELGSQTYRAVIHAAAVSDYSVQNPEVNRKLPAAPELNLKLKANFKILPRLREYSRSKETEVIGFKLTLNVSPEAMLETARGLLSPAVDAVIANDWSAVSVNRERHPGALLVKNEPVRPFGELTTLAHQLHALFLRSSSHDSMS